MVLSHMVVVNVGEKLQEFCQAKHNFSISQTWTTSSADDLKKLAEKNPLPVRNGLCSRHNADLFDLILSSRHLDWQSLWFVAGPFSTAFEGS